MDKDWSLSHLSSGPSQSNQFVVPPSQPDSQTDPAGLPALQQTGGGSGDQSDSEVVYPVMETGGEHAGSVILVTDSEVERVERPSVSDDVHTVEETVSEDNAQQVGTGSGGGTSSEETANITVIARDNKAHNSDDEDDPMSQDLFQRKKGQDEGDDPVSTPSRHMPSLQLSGEPMLVPETIEESLGDQPICPSPDAYDNMPRIIPSTPTMAASVDDQEREYQPGDQVTLNSQSAQPLTSSSNSQKQSADSKDTGQVAFAGPTLAADVPQWQQSQSLNLCLTTSSTDSQRNSQRQTGQSLSQQKKAQSTAASASQDSVGAREGQGEFEQSQNLRLCLSQSQETPCTSSGAALSPVVKGAGTRSQAKSSSSSTSDSTSLTSRVPAAKPVMSIGMLHSQSQSASETTFILEKPDVSGLEGRTQTQGGASKMNVFQRTRQGKRTVPGLTPADLSQDSEDVLADVTKSDRPGKAGEWLSDSDPIPCSQNRPRPRPARQPEKMSPQTTEEEDRDAFNIDTVMDSEPEDDGTQSYDVFPALSKNLTSVVIQEEPKVEHAQVPELLPSTATVSPQLLMQGISASAPPAHCQTRAASPASPAQQAQSQTNAGSRAAGLPSKAAAGSLQRSQSGSQVPTSAVGSHPPQELSKSQPPQQLCKSQPHQPSQTRSQPVRSEDRQSPAPGGLGRSSQPGKTGEGKQGGGRAVVLERVSENPAHDPPIPTLSPLGSGPRKGSQGALLSSGRPQQDMYEFHGSQSQLVEGEGVTERTGGTAHMTKSKPKGTLGRKRKCLVKKRNEPSPRKEAETKSSSTSADTDAAARAFKPNRRGKKTQKFTRLQKSAADFKRPAIPALRKSVGGDSVELQPLTSDSRKQGSAVLRAPSTSGTGVESTTARGNQEGPKLSKRKSVEFSDSVQIGLPSQQLSLEPSLSDSQSSDTVLEITNVTQYVMRYVKQITSIKRINKDGQVIMEKTSEEEGDHELIEETEMSKKRRLTIPLSPSRSGSTLTSGDLADISSSSLSLKASCSLPSSSLERAASSLEMSQVPLLPAGVTAGPTGSTGPSASGPQAPPSQWRLSSGGTAAACGMEHAEAPPSERSLVGRTSAGISPALSFISPNQSTIEHDESRLDAVVTSSSSGRGSEPLFSADNMPTSEIPSAQPPPPPTSLSSSSSGVVPPTAEESKPSKKTSVPTPRSSRKSTRRAPADSSQEGSKQSAKPSLSLESQTFVPVCESGGFTVAPQPSSRKKVSSSSSSGSADRTLKQQVETTRATRAGGSSSTGLQSEETAMPTPQQPPQVKTSPEEDATPETVQTVSKLDIGAYVMCKWKDGFFYPAKFIGLNTGIGNKFKVLFEDGMEKTVRAVDMVMAQNLPLGQSVLVMGSDGVCDPGIILKHVDLADSGLVSYDVAMDDGSTRRCKRSDLLLSEDQASCLLSDEEYRATFGEGDMSHVNTADVSLDNVIMGKRLRTKGSPAVGVPRLNKSSVSSTPSKDDKDNTNDDNDDDDDETKQREASPKPASRASKSQDALEGPGERTRSGSSSSVSKSEGRKRKMGPVATSTPTPKQAKTNFKQSTPRKATRESFSPLGAAVASPENQKRPTRKARVGLFENVKGPIPSQGELFAGCVFLLSHVDKKPSTLAEERRQLQDSAVESSTEESTDDGGEGNAVPFDRQYLQAQIEGGGGTVIDGFDSFQAGEGKKLYLICSSYIRTVKYFQCLAANVPIVSHMWIKDSCEQNQLLDYKAYTLPAGISLEKHKLMERVYNLSCLVGQRVLLTSKVPDYVAVWTTVLEIAGCKIFNKFPATAAKRQPGLDVVVTDHTCDQSLVDRARQLGVPIVSSEWLVQGLINNSLPPHDGHAKYAHDYFGPVADQAYKYIKSPPT